MWPSKRSYSECYRLLCREAKYSDAKEKLISNYFVVLLLNSSSTRVLCCISMKVHPATAYFVCE